jgi:hypothetical protein
VKSKYVQSINPHKQIKSIPETKKKSERKRSLVHTKLMVETQTPGMLKFQQLALSRLQTRCHKNE